MLSRFNNIITMNRGDTYTFSLDITDNDEYYELQGNDAVYFGLMDPEQIFENALVRKKLVVDNYFNDGGTVNGSNITFTLKPEDTADLIPGKYYYMIKLKMDHDEFIPGTTDIERVEKVCTVINKTKFIILE